MMTEAINIIELYAVQGQAPSLASSVLSLVNELGDISGCIAYHAVRSPANDDVWIVTGQWVSKEAMEEHFYHPALNNVMKLLGCHAVSRIAVSSFIKTGM